MRKTRPAHLQRGAFLRALRTRGLQVFVAIVLCLGVLLPSTTMTASAQARGGATEMVEAYTVQRGDTLAAIAMMFGVSQEALMQANMLRNPNMVYVGQQLIIPARGGMQGGMGGPECASYHTVRRGDTLSEIALYQGLDAYALARANGLYDLNEIYVGQKLCIPGSSKGMGGPEKPMEGPQRPKAEPAKSMPMPAEGPQRPMEEPAKVMPMPMPAEGPQRPMGEPDKGMPMPMPEGPQRPMGEPDKGMSMDQGNRPGKQEMRPTEYWKGMYFTDKYFSEFAMERQDLEVNFNWGTGSPFGNSNENRFSVRWEKVEFFKGGTYTFFATADDGVRVYVDDQLIIDGWVIQPATDYKADIHLGEGPHKLVVEYYEEAEDAKIRVYWEAKQHRR